jgi:hypothetical protein
MACCGFAGPRVPAGTSRRSGCLSELVVHTAAACPTQAKLVPSIQIRCRITASLRASATLARLLVFPVAGLIVPLIHRREVEPVLAFLAVGLMIGPLALTHVLRDLPSSAFPARRSFFAAVWTAVGEAAGLRSRLRLRQARYTPQ